MTHHAGFPLSPERGALVLIDVQNDYCHPAGALSRGGGDVSAMASAVEAMEALLSAARNAAVPCVHVRTKHSEWTDTPDWLARREAGDRLDPRRHPLVQQGTWGAQGYRIAAEGGERVLVKHRYSAFAHTPLELCLRARQRDVVVLAGITSDLCVRATALDALAHGFRPVLAGDATASTSRTRHESALTDHRSYLGPVISVSNAALAWSPAGRTANGREPATAIAH